MQSHCLTELSLAWYTELKDYPAESSDADWEDNHSRTQLREERSWKKYRYCAGMSMELEQQASKAS